jgi:hypothetical protein
MYITTSADQTEYGDTRIPSDVSFDSKLDKNLIMSSENLCDPLIRARECSFELEDRSSALAAGGEEEFDRL